MSTERAEVLAVMDDCESLLAAAKIRTDLAAARAAVVELIEALRNSPCFCEDSGGDGDAVTCDRCRALARIGAP